MGMTPGNQAITGGTVLRTPAIQSPDFVAGVSGWIIRSDGSAEFNAGTFRGSIEVGSLTGQHFIVNNPATGDIVDVYDSLNRLVLKIDALGELVTFDQPAQDSITVAGNAIQFQAGSGGAPNLRANIIGSSSAAQSSLQLVSGNSVSGFGDADLTLADSNFPGATIGSFLKAYQRGKPGAAGIDGTVLQTDIANGAGQLVHIDTYTFNTNAGGAATFNHNAGFTPIQGFLAPLQTGINPFAQYAWFAAPFTSTTAHGNFLTATGAAYANQNGAGAFGIFIG